MEKPVTRRTFLAAAAAGGGALLLPGLQRVASAAGPADVAMAGDGIVLRWAADFRVRTSRIDLA